MAEIVKIVAQYGGLSALVSLGLAWACYKLYSQLSEIQNTRVKESNELRTEMLAYSSEMNKALEASATAMLALKDAVKDSAARNEAASKDLTVMMDGVKDATNALNAAVTNLKDLIVMKDRG